MPDLPKLNKTEFENALLSYLDWLEKNMGQKGGFLGWVQNVLPGQSPKEYANELYNYYMGIADSQGIGEWIPGYENILAVGAPQRLQWEQRQQLLSQAQQTADDEFTKWLAREKLNLDKAGEQRLREQLDLQKQNAEIGKQQWRDTQQQQSWEQLNKADTARWTAQGEASRLETERMMSRLNPLQKQKDELDRRQNEMQWESIRNDILSTVQGSPRNWIQTARASAMTNPYTKEPESFGERLATLREDYKSIKQAASDVRTKINDSQNSNYTWENIAKPQTSEQQMAAIILNAEKDITTKLNEANVALIRAKGYGDASPQTEVSSELQEEAQWAVPQELASGGATVGRPSPYVETRTKVPTWLQTAAGVGKYVPPEGQKIPILTPSGQSWSALSPTQKEMWGGLANTVGQRSESDILNQMQVQLPQNPSLGRRWQPARARV